MSDEIGIVAGNVTTHKERWRGRRGGCSGVITAFQSFSFGEFFTFLGADQSSLWGLISSEPKVMLVEQKDPAVSKMRKRLQFSNKKEVAIKPLNSPRSLVE